MDDLQRAQLHPSKRGRLKFWSVALICSLAALTTWYLLMPMSFIFGAGWVAIVFPSMLLFGVMLLFKSLIFKRIYANHIDDDTVLLEYFSQQNAQQNGDAADEAQAVELLENALHLRERNVDTCMTHRNEIVHIDISKPVTALRQLFADSQLSRIIVVRKTLDQVVGYVHVQQMFDQPRPINIRKMVLPIESIAADTPINVLLNHLIRRQTNIALVTDAQQQLVGLITLENALEQLFGNIDDEHDE
jgi:Mg2+/Co2+ transporter CorB